MRHQPLNLAGQVEKHQGEDNDLEFGFKVKLPYMDN